MALTNVGKEGITGVSNASDATAITIDSSEKVGIGLTSPQELLHLKDGDIVVGNGTASNSSSIGKIGFSTDSSNSRFIGIESFRGGDAANADLRFHTFGGDSNSGERMKIDTAGIMTVLSEGRAVTTSVQQGLCKCWAQLDGTGTIAIADSFNIGSATDQGTGDYSLTITNDMANLDWFGSIMDFRNRATTPGFNFDTTTAVGAVRWSTYDSSAQDLDPTGIAIWGDLA
jgi:hypothetical protein